MLEPDPEPSAAILSFVEDVFMPTRLVKHGMADKQKKPAGY